MKNIKIYTDRIRVSIITVVHLLFIGLLISLIIANDLKIGYILIIGLIILLFSYATVKEIIKLFNPKLLYTINSSGISDYNTSGSPISIDWKQVIRSEMISDNNNYQIAIVGEDDTKDYTFILIDRYSFRWGQFKKIWNQVEFYADKFEFEIVNNTPLTKK